MAADSDRRATVTATHRHGRLPPRPLTVMARAAHRHGRPLCVKKFFIINISFFLEYFPKLICKLI
jgi:hypothetical protein